jgi:hypothetical protein|tara:strand:+ start:152 stop:448 length:297 start_codon:yes stop_codon:yes gene_type:complete
MTLFYQTNSWTSQPQVQPNESQIELWKHIADKANWRIVQLSNGYYQTEYQNIRDEKKWEDVTRRETLKAAETSIDKTIEHYQNKIEFINGPKVVKTFK